MAAISLDEIKNFVAAWYRALDFHVPLDEIYTLLADKGLDMQFPDGNMKDYASFKLSWEDRVTNLFFDENHYVQTVDAKIKGDQAVLDIVVGWQASLGKPHLLKASVSQWTPRSVDGPPVEKKSAFGLEILTYNRTVEPFKYAPGFSRL